MYRYARIASVFFEVLDKVDHEFEEEKKGTVALRYFLYIFVLLTRLRRARVVVVGTLGSRAHRRRGCPVEDRPALYL